MTPVVGATVAVAAWDGDAVGAGALVSVGGGDAGSGTLTLASVGGGDAASGASVTGATGTHDATEHAKTNAPAARRILEITGPPCAIGEGTCASYPEKIADSLWKPPSERAFRLVTMSETLSEHEMGEGSLSPPMATIFRR